ncbi:type I phosphodiesterase/nucleotide pyrophosphatase [Mollisia scopiformis]|uniref:Type I phosphodiesterase/nucleotide pyrophosphatase n=1 Tax=Mollisia scopiformis TaxID=149040 RepID=A0A194XTS5_MOLSC|nr:type I phosphodiesterase/nucleotide pyrophosphatase [Mollisia scopiformis]KUJ23720.1 type I phosphodiesterase/nucleotide pyrophosphatase [Mollisia scopiformis]
MLLKALAFAAAVAPALATDNDKVYKHVVTFSVDGLHGSDVEKYVAKRPDSTIATLLKTAYEYTDCYTSAPSDSYPGVAAFVSGADPRTTGIWYDDTYDRSFWSPYSTTGTNCSGPPGAEVTYDETKDYDSTKVWSGGIDPANLPQSIIGRKCTWTYPHQRIRVNTIYEIVEASGKQTAYTDKHPAYDMVRGPSGKGLSVGYFPEIQAFDTTNLTQIIGYDQMHVNSWLAWINGTSLVNSEVQDPLTGIPTLFGGNFQAVSVGQKTYGYVAGSLDFTPELLRALDFVDNSIGQVVSALKTKGVFDDTLIIVASKHGQAPIDPTLYNKVDQALLPPAIKVPVAFITTDDIGLVFLVDARDTDAAVDNLNGQRDALKIDDIISGDRLTYLGYGDPSTDPAVPNIIIKPKLGTIYTTSTSKIAEHGGLSDDDRKVACFASATNIERTVFNHQVFTKEFAPTILQALGLDPMSLQGVVAEGGKVIDGFRG